MPCRFDVATLQTEVLTPITSFLRRYLNYTSILSIHYFLVNQAGKETLYGTSHIPVWELLHDQGTFFPVTPMQNNCD